MAKSKTTGERLKELVALVEGLSLREFADLANVADSYPALIISGERKNIGGVVAVKLARVLGTTSDYLLSGVGEAPKQEAVIAAVAKARLAKRGDTDNGFDDGKGSVQSKPDFTPSTPGASTPEAS